MVVERARRFEEFCRDLLLLEGFRNVRESDVVDEGFDFLAEVHDQTPQGVIITDWMVQLKLRIPSKSQIHAQITLSGRLDKPLLLIVSEPLPASLLEYLREVGTTKYYTLEIWDGTVLARKVEGRPRLAQELKQILTPEPVQPDVRFARRLELSLTSCKPGGRDWKTYESTMAEILQFLFVPPLGSPYIQVRTVDNLEVRDALFPNRADGGFWLRMQHLWGCYFALFEFKNLSKGVGAEEVDQVRLYTQRKSIGRLAFLIGRRPARRPAYEASKVAYQYTDVMVVLLDETHILEMLKLKGRGQPPELVLDPVIDGLLLKY